MAFIVTADPVRAAAQIELDLPVGATTVTFERRSVATGNTAGVRGYVEREVGAGQTNVLAFDWEVPLGIDLVYTATVTTSGADVVSTATFRVDDARDWLVDLARPTNTFPIEVESLPVLDFDGPVGVHRILDRRDPVLTTAPRWTPTGTLTLITGAKLERDRARAILGSGVASLLRTPPERGIGNLYFGVLSLREQRAGRLASYWDRRFVVELVQIERPDASGFVPLAPLTYAERLVTWPTYAEATATGESYQELAYTFPPDRFDPGKPWLPDDV